MDESVLATPRTISTNFRLTLSESQPKTGPEKMVASVDTAYTIPAWAGLKPAYSVARTGNSPLSISAVPAIKNPSPTKGSSFGRDRPALAEFGVL